MHLEFGHAVSGKRAFGKESVLARTDFRSIKGRVGPVDPEVGSRVPPPGILECQK